MNWQRREYIKKILLVAMIGESTILDFASEPYLSAKDLLQVEVLGGTKLGDIAKIIEIKPSQLLSLNKQFKEGAIPKEKRIYNVTIPEEKMILFYLRYELPEEQKSIKPYLVSHYVSLGEALKIIAKQYHSSIEEIKAVNQLNDDFLVLDTLLVIPVSRGLFEETLKD